MNGYSILPQATTIEMATQNLRAFVRLVPSLQSRETASKRSWEDFSLKSHKIRDLRKR